MATLPVDVPPACGRQDVSFTTDRVGEGDGRNHIAVQADGNGRQSCWDAPIAERTFSQLLDTCPMISGRLPPELWEQIIDVIADDNPYADDTLRRLGQVCRGWYARCRFRIQEVIDLSGMDKKQVYRLINILSEHPERCHVIKTVSFDFGGKSVGIFGSFTVRMMQKLPRVELLRIENGAWAAGQLHTQVFLHVTLTFESVTKLLLHFVPFPSAVVFWRLIRALPRLSSLSCMKVRFKNGCNMAGVVRVQRPLRLDVVDLSFSDDVADVLASIGAHLRHLSCNDRASSKLLRLVAVAAESLSSVHINVVHYGFTSDHDRPSVIPIDLTLAIKLHAISFASYLQDMGKAASVLSCASLPKLAEITIVLRLKPLETTPVEVQDALDKIDSGCYAQLDHSLSSRQFPALRKVVFLLQCDIRSSDEVMSVITEGCWRTQLSARLPVLHASGRLL
ncbi:uncharacterized protein FIBRA_02900 [Fibroporia radiculosa]|uniref:F-box domain-containing protein n=1 Tax=Fibroporia radiculosa TaxID=599839 RepID=J4GN66_9APHY|nr:uncharacterized protein FIBRA_02900 [Fibroporia radiculosa]CCM00855.1 predicted protein [Fibroporia radiculosa]